MIRSARTKGVLRKARNIRAFHGLDNRQKEWLPKEPFLLMDSEGYYLLDGESNQLLVKR